MMGTDSAAERETVASMTHQGLESDQVYVFPVTFAQQRLLFLYELDPDSTTYNIQWSIRITGKLDVDALEKSLTEIVHRHEILRTTYDIVEGHPVQILSPAVSVPLDVTDLSQKSDPEVEAQEAATREAQIPVDLKRGPIVRTRLLRLSGNHNVLLVTTHHIAFDGWSRRTLVRELARLYQAFRKGKASPLENLPLQYADYAVWQREYLKGEHLEELLHYWKNQLAGAPTTLDLPTDRPRPAVQSFRGAARSLVFTSELSDEVARFSRTAEVTSFMTLLACFQVLMSRYTGQNDLLVGTTIANRNRPEIEGLIGLFANTLPLRTKLDGDPTFSELLGRVKETALGAYAHQEMPFDRLVEELRPERSLSYNPLFQVVFSLQNSSRRAFELEGLKLEPLGGLTATTSKFDLSFFLAEDAEGLAGRIEYNTDLFDSATIDRMLDHYQLLLAAALREPETRISQLPLVTEEEHRLLSKWTDDSQSFAQDSCIHELFELQAQRTPHATAVVFEDDSLTYHELNQRANQLAHKLRAFGVGPEVLVGICVERSLNMVVAILGVLKAGGGYLPLDIAYPKNRRAFMLEDARVPVLLTESGLLAENREHTGVTICLDSDWPSIATQSTENPAHLTKPGNVAYVIYTSGSTGKPKGVMVTHANVGRLFTATDHWFGFGKDDVWTLFHSFAFDFSVWEIWGALLYGGKLIVVPLEIARSPEQFHELLVKHRVTVLNQTPSAFKYLIVADQQSVDWDRLSLRYVIFGGEALEFKTLLPWIERHRDKPALINMYGITETTVHVTYFKINPANVGEDSVSLIGIPIPDLQVYILDSQRQPVPIGVPGEIYVGGYGVARGYLNRPELSAERFIANPFKPNSITRLYKTGDLARFRPDGNIQYMGRIDQQVKIRGFRIELGEIETELLKHDTIEQSVVVVREDRPGDKRLVAYVAAKAGRAPNSAELRTHLEKSLPEYMVPGIVIQLDSMPLTQNGKINRGALPAPDWSHLGSRNKEAPSDQLEVILIRIWELVLGVRNIGVNDNFFDLGGHSLLAVKLLSEVEKVVGRKIPLASLFRGSTIAAQAKLLRGGSESEPEPLVMEYQAGKVDTSPFFAVAAPGVRSLGYAILARQLGETQPFYKLQAAGPIVQGRPLNWGELRNLAQQYVAGMRAVQPEGPYYLVAMCGGCQIAEQMILHLESQGQVVAMFAIFDTWVLEHAHRRWAWMLYGYQQRLRWLRRASLREGAAWASQALANRARVWAGTVKTSKPWAEAYWPEDFEAPRFKAPVILFKQPRQPYYYIKDPLLGWGARSQGGVTIYEIKANHHEILREPHVQIVSQVLLEFLNRSEPALDAEESESTQFTATAAN